MARNYNNKAYCNKCIKTILIGNIVIGPCGKFRCPTCNTQVRTGPRKGIGKKKLLDLKYQRAY